MKKTYFNQNIENAIKLVQEGKIDLDPGERSVIENYEETKKMICKYDGLMIVDPVNKKYYSELTTALKKLQVNELIILDYGTESLRLLLHMFSEGFKAQYTVRIEDEFGGFPTGTLISFS